MVPRLDFSAFFVFFAARFSSRLLPCFLFCPDGGALFAMIGSLLASAPEGPRFRAPQFRAPVPPIIADRL